MSFKEFLNESKRFDIESFAEDIGDSGVIITLEESETIYATIMEINLKNSLETKNGLIPLLRNFDRIGKQKDIDVRKGEKIVVDENNDYVYGATATHFWYAEVEDMPFSAQKTINKYT